MTLLLTELWASWPRLGTDSSSELISMGFWFVAVCAGNKTRDSETSQYIDKDNQKRDIPCYQIATMQ